MKKRIHGGVEVLEQEEGGDDDEHEEEGVVVEDREGGGLVVSDLIFLPQNPKQYRKNLSVINDVSMRCSVDTLQETLH